MKIFFAKKYLALILPMTLMTSSCSDMLDQTPEIAVTSKNVWSSEYDALKVINSMYLQMRGFTYFRWIYESLRGREFSECSDYSMQHFHSGMLQDAYRGFISWSQQYKVIAFSNLIIDNIDQVANMNDVKRNYNKGCAYFMRAFNYFELLRYYGEAPLTLHLDNMNVGAKSTKQELFLQIESDLKEAQRLIGNLTYQTLTTSITGLPSKTKMTPTQGSVNALFAHVYAWQGSLTDNHEYLQLSVDYASKVISSSEFKLATTCEQVCTDVMKGNSDEGIFEIEYSVDEQNGSSIAFYLTTYPVVNGRQPNDFLYPLNQFIVKNAKVESIYNEPNDARLNAYFYQFSAMKEQYGASNGDRPYFYKWRYPAYSPSDATQFVGVVANEIIYRLSDIILLRAEIYNRLGQTQLAKDDLNRIRNRASLDNYDPAVNGDLKLAILRERNRELYMEGTRMSDLIRNDEVRNMLPAFASSTDQDVADGCYYMPVEAAAFLKNPAMRQNAYWKRNGF